MCLSLSVSTKLSKQYLKVGAKDGIFTSIVRPALKRLHIAPSKIKSTTTFPTPIVYNSIIS